MGTNRLTVTGPQGMTMEAEAAWEKEDTEHSIKGH